MRFRNRHAHETVVKYITEALTEAGWVTPPINFGAAPVTILSYQPVEAGEAPKENTVAISFGDETPNLEWELGGIEIVTWALFVDIYCERIPVSESIAADVKDMLTDVVLELLDFTTNDAGVPTTDQLQFEDVAVEIVPSTASIDKRTWRSVKAMCHCYFG